MFENNNQIILNSCEKEISLVIIRENIFGLVISVIYQSHLRSQIKYEANFTLRFTNYQYTANLILLTNVNADFKDWFSSLII